MSVRKPKALKEYPLGSLWNPLIVKAKFRVRFEYDPGNAFEVTLHEDGTLDVRMSGNHSDLISTHHHVSNNTILVPRRWSGKAMRHVDFIDGKTE